MKSPEPIIDHAAPPEPDEAAIREHAYHLWLQEGRVEGRDREHWFKACEAVRARTPLQHVPPPRRGIRTRTSARAAQARLPDAPASAPPNTRDETSLSPWPETPICLRLAGTSIEGDLALPAGARALVLVAHASGHEHHGWSHRLIIRHLNSQGIATLHVDLLSRSEEARDLPHQLMGDLALLAERIEGTVHWLRTEPSTRRLRLAFFGIGHAGCAALRVAAAHHAAACAVVAQSARPDLVNCCLPRLRCPTLLIVGGWDDATLQANREALAAFSSHAQLYVVHHMPHTIEDPHSATEVAHIATEWLQQHLPPPETGTAGAKRKSPRPARPVMLSR